MFFSFYRYQIYINGNFVNILIVCLHKIMMLKQHCIKMNNQINLKFSVFSIINIKSKKYYDENLLKNSLKIFNTEKNHFQEIFFNDNV